MNKSKFDDLEYFTKTKPKTGCYITIYDNKTNDVGISSDILTTENFNPAVKNYIHLAYSKINNAICFKLSRNSEKGCRKVFHSGYGMGAKFNAMVFFKQFDIDSKKYKGRHPAIKENIDRDGILDEFWIVYLKGW